MRTRVPVQLQAASTECGLACAAMVLSALGSWTTIRELRELVDPGRDGMSLRAVRDLLRDQGVGVVGYRSAPQDLAQLPVPLVATWDSAHFVVIERVRRSGVTVVDPAHGRTDFRPEEFAAHYGGMVLAPVSTDDLVRRPRRGSGLWSFVAPHLGGSRRRVGTILGLGLLLTALGVVPAAVTQVVLDNVIPSGDPSALWSVAVLAGMLLLTTWLLNLWRSEVSLWFERRLDASMMSAVLERLLALPYRYFQLRSAGDLLVRFSSTSFIRDVLSGRLVSTVVDSVFVVGYLVVVGMRSGLYVAVVLVIGAVQIGLIAACGGAARRRADVELTESASAQSVLLETVRAVETVKALNLQHASFKRWQIAFGRQMTAGVARSRLDNHLASALDAISFVAPVVLLAVGATLVIGQSMTVGALVALNALALAALTPVRSIGLNFQVIQTVRVHLERLRDVMEEAPEDVRSHLPRREVTGAVELHDVSFRYGTAARDVVAGVSCTIPAGSFVAIVGPSGSGKSTLARLLFGLLTPTGGQVSYDGVPLDSINLEDLRTRCGMVTQDAEVISGSIAANVRAGRDDITDEDVARALEVAALADDVAAMPLGLDTPLGESGIGLSGGQKQRLAIARALAHRPRLLVLDEATSHLDGPTEQRVTERLRRLETTRVVIAHRLSTVRDADQILFLDSGCLVASGTHDVLMRDERYRAFVLSQTDLAPVA